MDIKLVIGIVIVLYLFVSPKMGLAFGAIALLVASQKSIGAYHDVIPIRPYDKDAQPLCETDKTTRLTGKILDANQLSRYIEEMKSEDGTTISRNFLYLIDAKTGNIFHRQVDPEDDHAVDDIHASFCKDFSYGDDEDYMPQLGHMYLNEQKPALIAGKIDLVVTKKPWGNQCYMSVNDDSGHYMSEENAAYRSIEMLTRVLEKHFGPFLSSVKELEWIEIKLTLSEMRKELHAGIDQMISALKFGIVRYIYHNLEDNWSQEQAQRALKEAQQFIESEFNPALLSADIWVSEDGEHILKVINTLAKRLTTKGVAIKEIYNNAFERIVDHINSHLLS